MAYYRIKMKQKTRKIFQNIFVITLIIFGLFVIYQIIRRIFGGSWATEGIIIALLVFNMGAIYTMGYNLAEIKSEIKHFKNQFRSLASDFKRHLDQ